MKVQPVRTSILQAGGLAGWRLVNVCSFVCMKLDAQRSDQQCMSGVLFHDVNVESVLHVVGFRGRAAECQKCG